MNRMGPVVLVLATANALLAASMAGAVVAVVVFLVLLGTGFLFWRGRPGAEPATEQAAGPVGQRAVMIGRQGAYLLVRLGTRDWPASTAQGAPLPGYGDTVRVEAIEGAVLIVRPETRAGA
jgi:membrane protein implicated in regulation of membrane protease activity